jgi:preprotein translocase subunit SecE
MKLINYIQETKGELKHVTWPTRKQAIAFTIIVIVVSILTALALGFFDIALLELLAQLDK